MKFYIDAQPLNLCVEADDMHHALQRVADIDIGRNLFTDKGLITVVFSIDRISTKPSRKTEYREI